MRTCLAQVIAVSWLLYEAQVPTYGCNSGVEVSRLQAVRTDATTFEQFLIAQVAYGQCVTIPRGAVVEGSVREGDTKTLLINAKRDPPGYVVPLDDFKPGKAAAQP